MQQLGGVETVAIALSGGLVVVLPWTKIINIAIIPISLESATLDDFGHKMSLHRTDVEHLRSVFMAVENGDIGMLKSLGIRVRLISQYWSQ